MTRLTPLELAVLDALADELRDQLPDLPGQIAEALPGVRRNTGAGFSTEVIVDRNRPSPGSALTGRFGTIHGDVPGLIEPMAFQIDVAGGRLLALHGMTYDEATDAIDFASARVSGLFRIDPSGESVAWKPRPVLTDVSPLRVLQQSDEPAPSGLAQASAWDGLSPHIARSRQLIEAGQRSTLKTRTPVSSDADLPPDAVLVAGAIGVMAFIALIAIILFRLPIFAAIVLVGYGANLFRNAKAREMLRKLVIAIRAEGRT